MKKLIAATIFTLPLLAFAGARFPYICHFNNWHTLIAHGGNSPTTFYCLLPNNNLISTNELEKEFCNKTDSELFKAYSEKQAPLPEVLTAIVLLHNKGYREVSIQIPRADNYPQNLSKENICRSINPHLLNVL